MLAATILFIATNAGLIGVSRLTLLDGPVPPAARRAAGSCTRASGRRTSRSCVFGAVACLTMLPGQAEFLGTIYAFGAMLSFTIAHLAVIALRIKEPDRERPYRGPGQPPGRAAGDCRCSRSSAGSAPGSPAIVVTVARTSRRSIAGVIWLALGMSTYVALPAAARACRSPRRTKVVCRSRSSSTRSSTSPCSWRSRTRTTRATAVRTAVQARRPAAARHPRARDDHRPDHLADRRAAARAGGACAAGDRLGARARRPACDRPLGEGAGRPGRAAAIVEEARDIQAARDRHAATAQARRALALRAHARDRAGGAPVPGDHRVRAARGRRRGR